MAASMIQQVTGSTAGTAATTVTATLAPTAQGNSLIALYGNTGGSTATVPSISSPPLADGDWTKPDPPQGGLAGVTNSYMIGAYVHNIPAGITTVTFTTSARDQQIIVREVGGLASVAPAVAAEDFTNATTTTSPASAAGTITAGHFAIGWVAHGGTPTTGITAVSSPWTMGTAPAAAGSVHLRDAVQTSSPGGAQQAVFSGLSAGVRYSGGLFAFAPSAGGAKTIAVSKSSFAFSWTT